MTYMIDGYLEAALWSTLDYDNDDNSDDGSTDNSDKDLKELLRDFMNWIYKQLEKEDDYQNSKEYLEENILANKYEFLITGERA